VSIKTKIAIQFLVNNITIVTNFLLTILLARLLTPTDIGIFSMSAVLIGVAHVLRDFGVAAYLKRAKNLSEELIRSAFGLLLATSWVAAFILFLSAPYWASFFNESRISDVVQVLAIGFLFIPFGAIPSAILTRRLEVKKTSQVMLVSNVVHFFVCLLLAYFECAHMTMAWANLIDILVCGVGYRWVLGERLPWLPSFKGWGHIAHFGLGNVVPALLHKVDGAIPDLALGRLSNPAAVGLFSRASSTVNMLGEAINPTLNYFALPYLAQVHHKSGRIDREYLRASSLVNSIVFPVLVGVAALAPEIIDLLFGANWALSAEAIPWLCVAYGVGSLFSLTMPAMNSVGKPYGSIWPLFPLILAKVIFVLIFFNGELSQFAFGMAVAQLASVPLYLYINKVYLQVSVVAWFGDVMRLGALATLVGVACYGSKHLLLDGMHSSVVLVVGWAFTIVATLFGYWVLSLPIKEELKDLPIIGRKFFRMD
jgi:O-antigen/teichoic acid export membrane protein